MLTDRDGPGDRARADERFAAARALAGELGMGAPGR
jgi:hypothetical protein